MNRTTSPYIHFFFNDAATTEIYTLSLHDALPIFGTPGELTAVVRSRRTRIARQLREDRKSTRLNSSHVEISYAVFCLKKEEAAGDKPNAGAQLAREGGEVRAATSR